MEDEKTMDTKSIAGETGKTARSFFGIMKENPLSLALVISNLLLLIFLFYNGVTTLSQRRETVGLIVAWQTESDKLLANCVSKDIMQSVITALERDRELYRSLLQANPPPHQGP
jgi:hypothetical protein